MKKKKKMTVQLAIASALLTAGVALTACGSSVHAHHKSAVHQSTATQSSGPTISDWQQAYGSDVLAMLNDVATLGSDIQGGAVGMDAIAIDCTAVKADVAVVDSDPSIPDPTAASDLTGMTTNLSTAMDACAAYAASGDNSALDLMASSMSNADSYAGSLTADLGLNA